MIPELPPQKNNKIIVVAFFENSHIPYCENVQNWFEHYANMTSQLSQTDFNIVPNMFEISKVSWSDFKHVPQRFKNCLETIAALSQNDCNICLK